MRDLKWTRRATRKIARQLRRLNIRIGACTVGRLLKKMGFSLRVNHVKLESGNKNPPPRQCAIASSPISKANGKSSPSGEIPSSA